MLSSPEPEPEIIRENERAELKALAHNIALIDFRVNKMTGVRRGIVVREAERELARLEREQYG